MRLPAEWEKQSGVQLTWPDDTTPWYELDKVQECYAQIVAQVLKHESVLLVTTDVKTTEAYLSSRGIATENVIFIECPINDTWARDHGGIAVYDTDDTPAQNPTGCSILDFVFNGWGLKFASNLDNQITRKMFEDKAFDEKVKLVDMRPFVLEGGSIDSDGKGTMLATTECLCSLNRNEYLTRDEIEAKLKKAFGLKRILWLDEGSISGDDTDSHVDILARFCNDHTIAYLQNPNEESADYESLAAMEAQLKTFRTLDGKPYDLVPLPQPKQKFLDDYPLPASYANFLIINGAVLVPGTGEKTDEIAAAALAGVFPDREIVVIDCRPLLSGHGGLHCVTMQYPEGWLKK